MAIAQSRQVADMITERTGRQVEIVGVTTLGDVSRAQLTQIGGTGVFVSALREALLGGEVDLAVHSLKDLPTGSAVGVVLAAVMSTDGSRVLRAHGSAPPTSPSPFTDAWQLGRDLAAELLRSGAWNLISVPQALIGQQE